MDSEFRIPPLSNAARKPSGSNACGYFVCQYIGAELRSIRGEFLSDWLGDFWKTWKQRLIYLSERLTKVKATNRPSSSSNSRRFRLRKSKPRRLSRLLSPNWPSSQTSQLLAAITAEEQIKRNSAKCSWSDRRPEATRKVVALKHVAVRCSKCTHQSGCLDCDA